MRRLVASVAILCLVTLSAAPLAAQRQPAQAPAGAGGMQPMRPCAPPCGGGSDTQVPVIELWAPTGQVTQQYPYINVHFCDNLSLNASSRYILVNGVDRTGSFSYATGSGTECDPVTGVAASSNTTSVPLVPGNNPLEAHICDNAGNCATQTFIIDYYVPPTGQPTAPGTAIAEPVPAGMTDRALCLTASVGSGAAFECGDLRLVHALPATRTLNRAHVPTLIYNSQHAHPYPMVAANVTLPTGGAVPQLVRAKLRINGVLRAERTWPGGAWAAGTTRRIAIGFDGLNDATGVYSYSLEISNEYPGVYAGPTLTGELTIVNRVNSPFGAGWWLAGFEQFFSAGNRILIVGGDGTTRVYAPVGGWKFTTPNPSRLDTLDGSGADYVRLAPHGTRVIFGNPTGWRHTATLNRLGQRTDFTYDACNRLATITLPPVGSGRVYTFEYSTPSDCASRLWRVTAPPAGAPQRQVTLGTVGGRVMTITDPDQNAVQFFYSQGTNRVTSRVDRRQVTTTYSYDTGNRLAQSSITMAAGEAAITNAFRPLETLGLDSAVDTSRAYARINGPRTDVQDTTIFWLNAHGQPRRIVNALGQQTLILRQNSTFPALATQVTAPNGFIMQAAYDGHGNVSTTTELNPLGNGANAVTRYEWDLLWDFATKIVRPENDSVVMAFDATYGNRLWQQDGRGPSSRVNFNYVNGFHLASSTVSALGFRDSVEYDALGNLQRTRTPMGFLTEHFLDAIGRDTMVVTPTDSLQTAAYRDTSVVRFDVMDQDTLSISRGPRLPYRTLPGGITLYSDSERVTVRKAFDAEGNLLSLSRSALPDSNGLGAKTTTWAYDNAGRRRVEVAPDGVRDSTELDAAGNAVKHIPRRGLAFAVPMSYDALNRLIQRTTPQVSYPDTVVTGSVTWHFPRYCPDGAGGLNTLNSGQCGLTIAPNTATFGYDAAGNMVSADNADARVRRGYFPNGALAGDTLLTRTYTGSDFSQHVYGIRYGYDLDGRRRWMKHPSPLAPTMQGTVRDSVAYGYHPGSGALLSVRDIAGVEYRYVYDLDDRISSLEQWFGGYLNSIQETRIYDPDGRLIRRDDGRHQDTLRYDARGKVISVRSNADSVRNAYTGLGMLSWTQTMRYAPGAPGGHPEERHVQDALGNTASVYRRQNGIQDLEVATATLNQYHTVTGRLLNAWRGDTGSTTVGMATDVSTWWYDAEGNTTAFGNVHSITWDGQPEVFNERSRSYYAADGKLVLADRRTIIGSWAPNGTDFTDRQAFEEYRYDALGRRVLLRSRGEMGCSGTTGQPGATCRQTMQRFVWDGDQLLYEISALGNTGASSATLERDVNQPLIHQEDSLGLYLTGRVAYTHGLALDAPLNLYRMEFSDLFPGAIMIEPVTNWHGDYDNARGLLPCQDIWKLVGPGEYDSALVTVCMTVQWPAPYQWITALQRVRGINGSNWVGGLVEAQRDMSGLFYRRNRFYDPASGRFTQEDPIGLAGGLNLYGFAAGDPVTYSDPFGLCVGPLVRVCIWFLARGAPALTNLAADMAGVGVASRLAPGGGLAAHEGAEAGHTIALHVGRSAVQLAERLASNPRISAASSFFGRADAENAVAATVEANAVRIGDWLRSDLPRLNIRGTLSDAAGIVLERGASEAKASMNVFVQLVRDESRQLGYYIKTAYLEK